MNLKLVGTYSSTSPNVKVFNLDTGEEFTRIRSISLDLTVSERPRIMLDILPEKLELDLDLDTPIIMSP